MEAKEFKTAIKSLKDQLTGKQINIHFVYGNDGKQYSFNSLNAFGKAILHFESIGATFGFSSVSNAVCARNTPKFSDFLTVLNRGNWNEITFLATTVK
ncbi:hypothetical protein [Bizionia paragorgiae]|uniref:hypothetical protein n=1 Tax=Bizionia paragorgiae TaxID=283786 RepID=UPI003A8DFE9A